jgi:hypothetical protein
MSVCGKIDDMAFFAQTPCDIGRGFRVIFDQQNLHDLAVT